MQQQPVVCRMACAACAGQPCLPLRADVTLASMVTWRWCLSLQQLSGACALGTDLQACVARIERRESGLQPLSGVLGSQSEFGDLLGGWIPDRRVLLGRRYGASSRPAIWVSKAAVRAAGWSAADLRDAWLFVGSSRGNAGEILGAYPQRRPIKRFRASNLMHSEIGAAVSIELGIKGPWQVLSNGCASGLDALGFGCMALNSQAAQRVLVVAADLPLVPELLSAFRASGVLATQSVNRSVFTKNDGVFARGSSGGRDPGAWPCQPRVVRSRGLLLHERCLRSDRANRRRRSHGRMHAPGGGKRGSHFRHLSARHRNSRPCPGLNRQSIGSWTPPLAAFCSSRIQVIRSAPVGCSIRHCWPPL